MLSRISSCVARIRETKLLKVRLFSSREGLFTDDVTSNGLPPRFEWKLKCPIDFNELKMIDEKDKTYYCNQCSHNVYTVTNKAELKDRVSREECVTFEIENEAQNEIDRNHGLVKWRRLVGKLVRPTLDDSTSEK